MSEPISPMPSIMLDIMNATHSDVEIVRYSGGWSVTVTVGAYEIDSYWAFTRRGAIWRARRSTRGWFARRAVETERFSLDRNGNHIIDPLPEPPTFEPTAFDQ